MAWHSNIVWSTEKTWEEAGQAMDFPCGVEPHDGSLFPDAVLEVLTGIPEYR